jgi:hypothetical protein
MKYNSQNSSIIENENYDDDNDMHLYDQVILNEEYLGFEGKDGFLKDDVF